MSMVQKPKGKSQEL